jgi:hypothetical protein
VIVLDDLAANYHRVGGKAAHPTVAISIFKKRQRGAP